MKIERKKKHQRKPNQTNNTLKIGKKWEQNGCCMIGHKTYTLSNLVRFFYYSSFHTTTSSSSKKKIMNWIFILDNIHSIESRLRIVAYPCTVRIRFVCLLVWFTFVVCCFFSFICFHSMIFGFLFIQTYNIHSSSIKLTINENFYWTVVTLQNTHEPKKKIINQKQNKNIRAKLKQHLDYFLFFFLYSFAIRRIKKQNFRQCVYNFRLFRLFFFLFQLLYFPLSLCVLM